MQAEFEIAAGQYPHRLPLTKGVDGRYLDPHTNAAWLIWQAALDYIKAQSV